MNGAPLTGASDDKVPVQQANDREVCCEICLYDLRGWWISKIIYLMTTTIEISRHGSSKLGQPACKCQVEPRMLRPAVPVSGPC